jgi:hypothetical protein
MIEIFNDLYDAILFIETQAEFNSSDYFKAELLQLEDRRWRVGIIFESQMEMDI